MLDNTKHEEPAIVIDLNKEGTRQAIIPLAWLIDAIGVIGACIAFALILGTFLSALVENPTIQAYLDAFIQTCAVQGF